MQESRKEDGGEIVEKRQKPLKPVLLHEPRLLIIVANSSNKHGTGQGSVKPPLWMNRHLKFRTELLLRSTTCQANRLAEDSEYHSVAGFKVAKFVAKAVFALGDRPTDPPTLGGMCMEKNLNDGELKLIRFIFWIVLHVHIDRSVESFSFRFIRVHSPRDVESTSS